MASHLNDLYTITSQNKNGGYGWVTLCREGDREAMERLGFRYIDKGIYLRHILLTFNFRLVLLLTRAYLSNIISLVYPD